MDFVSPFEGGSEPSGEEVDIEEFNAVKAENEALKAEVAKLSRTPLTDPAKRTTVTGEAETSITGNKRLDRLARYCKK